MWAVAGLLRKTIDTDRSPQKGVVRLQLPGAEAAREIGIQLQPVKNRGENVKQVLILESEPPAAETEARPEGAEGAPDQAVS